MPKQLTLFDLLGKALSPASESTMPAASKGPAPIDPRRTDLLSGPQTLRAALGIACEALDADGVRARHAELNQRFTKQEWAESAPLWALGIEWLVGTSERLISVEEQMNRALALLGDSVVAERFPSLPRHLIAGIRAEALRRANRRLVGAHGVRAQLENGEPASWLLLRAGDAEAARTQLKEAVIPVEEADSSHLDFPIARAYSWLAEAEWRVGNGEPAVHAYCRACLLGGAVNASELTCEPILELVDTATDLDLPEPVAEWIPALAHLDGLVELGEEATSPPPGAGRARQLAAELAGYRLKRAAGALDEAARIEAKRRMLQLAPKALRERVRKL